jgi:adenine-specific DNA-methyltransferase
MALSRRPTPPAAMKPAQTNAPEPGALLLAALASLSAQQRRQEAALVQLVVRGWWQALETGLDLAPPPVTKTPPSLGAEVAAAARSYGESLAPLPVAEVADRIGALHAGLMPSDERARHGVYYTPPALAARLVDLADGGKVNWADARALDPAAGCGAFLVPIALRMAKALKGVEPALALRSIGNRLRGLELDPVAAWIAGVMVEAALAPLIRVGGKRLSVCRAVDALSVSAASEFDLVIGNPPYGRLTLAPDVRVRFARSLYGHANLYALFMDQAVRWTVPGGLIAFLTPSSFLAGDYFKHLRRTLSDLAPPLSLDFVDERKGVFDNVLQETVLATYRRMGAKKKRPDRALVNMIRAGSGGNGLTILPSGSFTLPDEPTAPWILPRHASETGLATRLRSLDSRLRDWGYRVATGPLVWNRYKPQIGDKPGKGAVPLVWAESVTPDGRFTYRCEKANHKPWFHPGAKGDEWLLTRRPCVLLQRTTAKEQARRLIAAEMPLSFLAKHPRGVTVENHLNMLLPLDDTPPLVPPAVLAAFLNSRAADRAFRCISGSVAVSAYELEAMPLPHPAAVKELSDLVAAGASRDRLDQAADRLYGIS